MDTTINALNISTVGNDYNVLKDVLSYIDNHTFFKELASENVGVLECLKKKEDGTRIFYCANGSKKQPARKGTLNTSKCEEYLNEGDDILQILRNDGNIYFPMTKECTISLFNRVGLSGESLSLDSFVTEDDETSYVTNKLNFLKNLLERNYGCKLMYREDDAGEKRGFHFFGGQGEHIPQYNIIEVIDAIKEDMGELTVKYEIDSDYTRVWVEFPVISADFSADYKKTDLIPGLYLETSDTSKCAFSVCGTIRQSKCCNVMYTKKVKKIHKGAFDAKKYKKEIEGSVFPEYRLYPQRFLDLALIDVTSPDDYINEMFEQTSLGVVLGKQKKDVKEYLLKNIPSPTTALDVVLCLMQCNIKAATRERQLALGSAMNESLMKDIKKGIEILP